MAEILGTQLPKIFSKVQFHINWVLILIIFLVIVASCIIIYVVYLRRTYKYRIICFENISGQGFQPTIRDKARILKIGDGGEELLFLQKRKVYRTAYGRKMGKNTYWFAKGQDGYEYNIVLGDLDAKMGMLDIEPIDRDMRYMHVAVRKNIQERYRKIKFMEKYGTILMSGLFVLIMIIGLGVLIKKMGDVANTINIGIMSANQVVATAGEVVNKLAQACGGGTGIVPAI
jgi:hypothetical protein